jgi:queuine tRNA-ribosyltransferase
MFTLKSTNPRRGTLKTAHGSIETPFFMPVATTAAMKGLTFDDLHDLNAQLTLCNTYHLHLQPGEDTVDNAGGLHNFMHWNKPILTDSGGFQVFSLLGNNKITDKGVTFRSHLDGRPLFIGPQESITIQHKLGADMIMVFDECPPSTAPLTTIKAAVERTLRWAKQCKEVHEKLCIERENKRYQQYKQWNKQANCSEQELEDAIKYKPMLFAISQGAMNPQLRKHCTEELVAMDFDAYAIGGVAVGESQEEMYQVVDMVTPLLPEDKLRYIMGIGLPHQLEYCISKGIDMFDCVLPMRIARHGTMFMNNGESIRIQNKKYKEDFSILDEDSLSTLSQQHSKSYVHHLFRAHERYGETIAAKQNIAVLMQQLQKIRGIQ